MGLNLTMMNDYDVYLTDQKLNKYSARKNDA